MPTTTPELRPAADRRGLGSAGLGVRETEAGPRTPEQPPGTSLETTGVKLHFHNSRPTKPLQQKLFNETLLLRDQLAATLDTAGRSDLATILRNCHSTFTIAECTNCAHHVKFPNHCDNFWCPCCQPGLQRRKMRSLEWWSATVRNPKHVVLTQPSLPVLTRRAVRLFKKRFGALRRTKFARNWLGGFYSLEVTRSQAGWHLHLHALIQADWIDQDKLAREWGKRVKVPKAVVWVKDASKKQYLSEVSKYSVKGTDLATWPAEAVLEFINAFQSVRTLATFGSARQKNAAYAAATAEVTLKARTCCACGGTHWRYFSPSEWEWEQIQRENAAIPWVEPHHQDEPQFELLL
jgi:hypothetical protein